MYPCNLSEEEVETGGSWGSLAQQSSLIEFSASETVFVKGGGDIVLWPSYACIHMNTCAGTLPPVPICIKGNSTEIM